MSYAEHGPSIFLTDKPGSGVLLTYGDYTLVKKRSEGRLKLYDSCTDIRAWSPNALESLRYFRELNERAPAPKKVIACNTVMERIALIPQSQNKLCIAQRELQKYKSLKLTSEQRKYLESLDKANHETRKIKEIKVEPIIKPLSQGTRFSANKLASLQWSKTYLSMYFHPDERFRHDTNVHNLLLTNIYAPKQSRNTNPLSENNTYLISRITSCNILNEVNATRESSDKANICEYVDAFSQTAYNMCEISVQTDEYNDTGIYYNKQLDCDSSSSQHYESMESASTSESELQTNLDHEACDKSHKGVIIQKDSEIIVLKNELGIKEDELEELRDLNTSLQTSLKEKDENANILKHNLNIMREKLKIISKKRNNEVEDLNAKLDSLDCLMNQLKMELSRRCQICYFQSQEIQKLKKQVKEAESLSVENDTLRRKVKGIEHLSKEAESCGIALEQVKNIWRERNMLQEQYHALSCMLTDRENEIKRLLTLIEQMSVTANTRQVEMNDVVATLQNEIQTKNDKISQFEMQLVCMEREVGNLTNTLKDSLNNLDESKIAYEGICEYTKCEHVTCLDVQSALSLLKEFTAELKDCKLERRSYLQQIDNLKACVTCYSQESVSEITNIDFDTGHESIRPIAEDVSVSSNYSGCYSSKKVVDVQIQSDDIETSSTSFEESEKPQSNRVISYEQIDRALAMHIKRSIDKISTILQGAGDHHIQIVKEYTKQQQELQKKDLEIIELKQKVAENTSRRGAGDCAIQEQLRKRMQDKEKVLEAVINKRDSEIERLHEDVSTLENQISAYRAECDALKNENADLVNAETVLSKENKEQSEELKTQRDQLRELIQQIDDLTKTTDILKAETNNIDDMKKKLIDLQMRNNDLTNKLVQANETICKNAGIIESLKCKDDKNKIALMDGNIKYDCMITQKHGDIVKLQDENQLLRDQLKETEIKLSRSNDTISLLREENDNVAAINVLQRNLSDLDKDKELLLAQVNDLRTEIASCKNSTTNIENELHELSCKNTTLKADIEAVKTTNDQLLHEDTFKWPLKDILYTLPGKIYEKIVYLHRENREHDSGTKDDTLERYQYKEITSEIENEKKKQEMKMCAEKACQQDEEFYTSQHARDKLNTTIQVDSENVMYKLELLKRQHEEKLEEMKNLMNDVKLRDYEIKNLQECITYLLQEKNDLQNKVKGQVEEYQNKLTLLKKKYDSSLNAFRKKHNESIERLQARFEDIMKTEKTPFDVESWLKSLNLKELAELHNRINILSSDAATNDESDITHAEAESQYRHSSEEQKFHNRSVLHKDHTNGSTTSSDKRVDKKETVSKILNIGNNNEEVAVTELYSHNLRLKQENRSSNSDKKRHPESPESIRRTLDWRREKFIHLCSIHHRVNNVH